MAAAFRSVTGELASRDALPRIIWVRGEGRAFSAGGDLKMLRLKAEKSVEENQQEMLAFYRSFLGLRTLNVPILVALHGHVVGAGLCFAAACDLRICDTSTKLSSPFTRLALHPGMGGSYFLPRSLGSEAARDMMLTGRRMKAEEALRVGFVSAVVEPDNLISEAERVVHDVLKSAPEATRAMMRNERRREWDRVENALHQEAGEQALCYARPEFLAGVEALQNKLSPPWA